MDAVIIDEVGSDPREAGSGTLFWFTRIVLALGNLSAIDHLMLSGIDGGSVSVVAIHVLDMALFCF